PGAAAPHAEDQLLRDADRPGVAGRARRPHLHPHVATLVLRGAPAAVPRPAIVYFVGIVLSIFPALVISGGSEIQAWTSWAAILMGFIFYVMGLNIGESRAVMTSLLAGVCCV